MITLDDFDTVGEMIEKKHTYPAGVMAVLNALRDGRWKTNRQIIKESKQIHITARIYECRQAGLNIKYLRKGKDHLYRWVQ